MKTKYIEDLTLRKLFGKYNQYDPVATSLTMAVGLLSALPDNFAGGPGDNWTGARELFSDPSNPYIYPVANSAGVLESFPGIRQPVSPAQTFAYAAQTFAPNDRFSEPYLTYNSRLDANGLTVDFPVDADLVFPFATGNWGQIKGIVIYGTAIVGSQFAIVPLLVTDLITPITIQQGQRFVLKRDNPARFTELLRKLPLI